MTGARFVAGLLLMGIAASIPARAAIWTTADTRLTPPGVLALTTPGRQTLVRLPGNRLYVVWYQRSGVQSAVVRGAEQNGEGIWSTDPTVLSLGDSLVRNPTLAAGPAGDLHLAWEDLRDGSEQIYYRHRTVDGIWENEEPVTTMEGESLDPVLGVSDSGRLHLLWSDAVSGSKEIYDCWRDPGGAFTPARRLTNHPGQSIQPNVAIDGGGDVHLVWQDGILDGGDDSGFNTEIWYMPLDAEGAPRALPVRVSRALGLSERPSVALGPGGSLHLTWSDGRDPLPNNPTFFPMAIWYRRWLPGLGFGHEKRFVFSNADHLNPAVATTPDGTVNVVWEDYSHGNSEIYYRQINPDTGWDVQPTRLTSTVGPTRAPSLLTDADGTLHLAWSDAGSGEEASIRYRSGQAHGTTAVRLAGCRLAPSPLGYRLEWTTSEEVDHAGFLIFLGDDIEGDARPIGGLIQGGPDYAIDLARGAVGDAPVLKLVALDRFGQLSTVATFRLGEVVPVGTGPLAAGPVYPNPVRTSFQLAYRLPTAGEVSVEIFDPLGRRVAGDRLGPMGAGDQLLSFDIGSGQAGRLASGRYLLRLTTPSGVATRPILVIR